MSEVVEMYQAINAHKKMLRGKYGVPCPECVVKLPRANPKILLPGEFCRTHRFTDPRPDSLMDCEYESVPDPIASAALADETVEPDSRGRSSQHETGE